MTRCPSCPGPHCRPVTDVGPYPCPVLLIGVGPGKREDQLLEPYVGQAGEELTQTYLPLARLPRSSVHIANCTLCLRGTTIVMLGDGSTERISKLVKDEYRETVLALDANGELTTCRVIGHHRSKLAGRPFVRLSYTHIAHRGGKETGSIVTADHRVYTSEGWVQAKDCEGLQIATGTPGLSGRQMSAVIGMILGDSSLNLNHARKLICRHPKLQEEYATWKKQLLSNVGMSETFKRVGFETLPNPIWQWLACKVDGITTYDKDFVEEVFDWSTLAIWLMDDGCLRPQRKPKPTIRRPMEICAKSRQDLPFLCDVIQSKLGVRCKVLDGRIHFGVDATQQIAQNCGQWFTPDLRYKLVDGAPPFDPTLYNPEFFPFYDRASVEPFADARTDQIVYCLDTEFHNFATYGGIVHNCYDGDKVPDRRVLDCARHHLPRILDRVKPEVIVLMGGQPQRICDTRIRLDMHRGRPVWTSVLDGAWEGWVWPTYEPALGMRETGRMTQLLEDFRTLGEWLRGEWAAPEPEQVKKDYRLLTSARQVDEYMMRTFRSNIRIAIDTESHGAEPWGVQFSHTPHTGAMIRTFSKDAMECFAKHLHDCETEGVLHFAAHDLDELDRMKVGLSEFRDTMQEAYHLCNLPQGLKPLAYRLLGVTMRSWEDVVWPASVNAIVRWMEDAVALAAENLTDVTLEQMVMGVCRECGKRTKKANCTGCGSDRINRTKRVEKLSGVQTVLTHILSHTGKTMEDDEPYNPWKALAKMRVEGLRGKVAEGWEWEYLTEALGPTPILGIGNCDLAEAVEYGCSDADHTGQVATVLEKERHNSKWDVAEEDWDV